MQKLKTSGAAVLSCALAVTSAVPPMNATAGYVNITHPAACVAPFLDQAWPMRWHEHFVLNPPQNRPTWLICPISLDASAQYNPNVDLSNYETYIEVIFGRAHGASSERAQCFFTSHSGLNAKLGVYRNGQSYVFTKPLDYVGDPNAAVSGAYKIIRWSEVKAAQGDAFGLGMEMAVFCRLPPGWGINSLLLTDDPARY